MIRAFAVLWAACLLAALAIAAPAWAGAPRTVPTFESIGVYWPLASQSEQGDCAIAFRPEGEDAWRDGLPLWFDRDASECRGSIIGLRPGTTYELKLSRAGETETLEARTWSESFPVGR
ncbi:MAG TPA: hypothetical protein VJ822_17225, partial [Dongiaceae bacterium]|nr:hypothetical protein [Dongiaceae bacterium]